MAFLISCALHDSSPRIWRKLIALGLHQNYFGAPLAERKSTNRLCTVVECGNYYNVKDENLEENIYDCKDNAELFFALAALRDDTDVNQWFIYDNRSWNDEDPQRFWFVCRQDSIEDDMCYDQMWQDCTKATARELVAHFTGDDDDEIMQNH